MHELALVESVVEAVVARVGQRRVRRVSLRVGALTAVMPDALQFCFDVATQATPLEGASLQIDVVAASARCRACQAMLAMADRIPLCDCGSADLEIVAGHELLIQDVEVT